MSYASWSVVFGEQPSAAKWNILGTNDASFNDGTGLNTGAVQQQVSTLYTATVTGTTTIPLDNTIPQSTEGDQYMSQVITPKATTNILVIEAKILASFSGANSNLIAALFQDAGANALAGDVNGATVATAVMPLSIVHTMAAGTTSATTFKVRIGNNGAGTTSFNGGDGVATPLIGAITKSSIRITEYKA